MRGGLSDGGGTVMTGCAVGGNACMTEGGVAEALCAMAGITFGGGRDVRGRFARRKGAIVATRTRSDHLRMVDTNGGDEGSRGMAGFAYRRRLNVRRRHAARIGSVVATRAVV